MSLTSPLGLMRHVQRPDLRLDMVPCLNVLAVGTLLALMGSSYISAPGLTVGLGNLTDEQSQTLLKPLVLPQISAGPTTTESQIPGRTIDAVLEAHPMNQGAIFTLPGGIHYMADLPKALQTIRKNLPNKNNQRPVLLLKADRSLSIETIMQVWEIAGAAGFDVHMAAVRGNSAVPAESTPASSASPTPASATTP